MDTDSRQIENCIDAIVKSYRINLVVQKERDERDREVAKRRAHLAHRRDQAEQRKQREQHRLEFLTSVAQARREVHELKLTISAMPKTEMSLPDYDRMLAWAMERLSDLEKRTAVEHLQQSLVAQNLFPERDDLFDPEGEPPPKRNYWDD